MKYQILGSTVLSVLFAGCLLATGASANDSQASCNQNGVTQNKPMVAPPPAISRDEHIRRDIARRDAEESRRKERLCANAAHGTPLFLREDLAYSVTGVDCFGNTPSDYSTVDGLAPKDVRAPASLRHDLPGRDPASSIEVNGIERGYEPVQ